MLELLDRVIDLYSIWGFRIGMLGPHTVSEFGMECPRHRDDTAEQQSIQREPNEYDYVPKR